MVKGSKEINLTKKTQERSLVVGGAGFIGSHLCEVLIAQNQSVLCIDDLTTGSIKNISHLQKSPLFTFIEADINQFDFNQIGKVKYIFHLAGLEAYLEETKPSLKTLLVNSLGTKSLLDYASSLMARFLYISSVDIYSGVASSLGLEFYYGRSQKDAIEFSHHEAKRFGEALVEEYRQRYKINARIVRLADVYGPRMNLDSFSIINQLFSQNLKGKPLQVPGDGVQVIHPTYVGDVIYGIQRAMLLDESEGKIYYLVSPKQTKVLELAEILSRAVDPPLKIEFQASEEIPFPSPEINIEVSKKDLHWQPKVSLEEGILRTLEWFGKKVKKTEKEEVIDLSKEKDLEEGKTSLDEKREEKSSLKNLGGFLSPLFSLRKKKSPEEEPPKPLEKEESKKDISPKQIKKRSFPKLIKPFILGLSFLLIFLGILSPLLLTAVFSCRGVIALKRAEDKVRSLNFEKAEGDLLEAEKSFQTAHSSFDDLFWLTSLFRLRDFSQDILYLLYAAEDVSKSLYSVSRGARPLLDETKNILATNSEKTVDFNKISGASEIEFALAGDKLAEAQASLKQVDKNRFPFQVVEKINELESQVVFARDIVERATQANRLLPLVVGQNEDRVYLILFQNNMERRATGGFIGSYARVLFKEGKIAEIKIDDVYNPDNQIRGQFEPPEALKKYLSVESWGMRDGNWFPDFSESAQKIESFYEGATGDEVDGVFALDLYFVQQALSFLGPVKLEDDEEVKADNLFQKAEYQSEVNFEEGSTSKKDFLGEVGFKMIEKIRELPSGEWVNLAGVLKGGLEQKHVLFYFKEPALEDLVLDQGWGGTAEETVGDYLMIVDSNVGGNKANYFVDRKINYSVSVDRDGELKGKLTLQYKHEGTSDAWPGGVYKNYLRVYVPQNSVLISRENFNEETSFTGSESKSLTVFEGYVEIEPNSEKRVSFEYSLPKSLKIADDKLEYSLLCQKQLGSEAEEFNFEMSWPQYLSLTKDNHSGNIQDQKYTLQKTLDVDQEIQLQFQFKPD